jgi:hypothetical protein
MGKCAKTMKMSCQNVVPKLSKQQHKTQIAIFPKGLLGLEFAFMATESNSCELP